MVDLVLRSIHPFPTALMAIPRRRRGLASDYSGSEGPASAPARDTRAALRFRCARPGEETMPIRVLLVDDQPGFRANLRALLELEPYIEVVGEADSGERALEHAVSLRLDVTLMDLG